LFGQLLGALTRS